MNLPPHGSTLTPKELRDLLAALENEHVEFKEAKSNYDFEALKKYCCALANEGGGYVVLGVTNSRPREVVGTKAFDQPERTRAGLMDKLHLSIGIAELFDDASHRILVFTVPGRPLGSAVNLDGTYWARRGDSLVPLTDARLRLIHAESGPDASAEIVPTLKLDDLDLAAIEDFRGRWIKRSKNASLATLSVDQLLHDAGVVTDEGVTRAALILFGKASAVNRHLPHAEVVFEYRSSEASGSAQERHEFRQGFFSFYDELIGVIGLRNDKQHYQEGLFVLEIPTFSERPVREALLNAVCHRDYRMPGNIFVIQYGHHGARRLVVESPGGLPHGITPENILDRQSRRNVLIADVFAKAGLVERSGQGMNLMFEHSIREGKQRPGFDGSDDFFVRFTLHGEVQDPRFVPFMNRVLAEKNLMLGTADFVVLDLVHREEKLPRELRPRLRVLVDAGVLESVGRGRGTRYLLSRRFYGSVGKTAVYTRKRGLDHEHHRTLLWQHLRTVGDQGAPISELQEVLPSVSRDRIKRLLEELRRRGSARVVGQKRGARWFAVAGGEPELWGDETKDHPSPTAP